MTTEFPGPTGGEEAPPVPCLTCGGADATPLLRIAGIPLVANAVHPTRRSALAAPKGEMRLVLCRSCRHLYNAAFHADGVDYGGGYENALHFSPTFREYEEALARRLAASFRVRGGRVLEIGAGDGRMLARLCELGAAEGVGFDPSHDAARSAVPAGSPVRIVRGIFSADAAPAGTDLFVSRHVLEHLAAPSELLREIRVAMERAPGSGAYLEVPNGRQHLEEDSVWDLIHEHCSYFTVSSLRRILAGAGLGVRSLETGYAGQFLCAYLGVPGTRPDPGDLAAEDAEIERLSRRFASAHAGRIARWTATLTGLRARGARAVLWGAGSKGVSFLNALAGFEDVLVGAVDLNPRKHGCHVAGSGQEIFAPERLRDLRPAVVAVANPIYRAEIEERLRALGVPADVLAA